MGELLKALRKKRNVTQEQLRDASGVSLSVIKWLETGRTQVPAAASVAALADALDLDDGERAEWFGAAQRATDRRLDALEGEVVRQGELLSQILARLEGQEDGRRRRGDRR